VVIEDLRVWQRLIGVQLFMKEYAKIGINHASSILIATGNLFPKLYFILLPIVI
jgi:hypothetical protein